MLALGRSTYLAVRMPRLRCIASTKHGAACRAPARVGSRFCLSHDPAYADALANSRRLGGVNRRRRQLPAAEAVPLRTLDNHLELLERAAAVVERIDDGASRARLMIDIAKAAANIVESADLARRLEELEAQVAEREGRTR